MKNINLEELERKQIYSVPESFFDEVQSKVLAQTVHLKSNRIDEIKPQAKVIPLKVKWSYIAAAIVVLLGLGFVLKLNLQEPSQGLERYSATQSKTKPAPEVQSPNELVLQAPEEQVLEPTSIADLQVQSAPVPKTTSRAMNTKQRISQATPRAVHSAAIDAVSMDQIITSLSSADLSELSRDAEMDVYLDLY